MTIGPEFGVFDGAVGDGAADRPQLRPVVVDRVGGEVFDPHLSLYVRGSTTSIGAAF